LGPAEATYRSSPQPPEIPIAATRPSPPGVFPDCLGRGPPASSIGPLHINAHRMARRPGQLRQETDLHIAAKPHPVETRAVGRKINPAACQTICPSNAADVQNLHGSVRVGFLRDIKSCYFNHLAWGKGRHLGWTPDGSTVVEYNGLGSNVHLFHVLPMANLSSLRQTLGNCVKSFW